MKGRPLDRRDHEATRDLEHGPCDSDTGRNHRKRDRQRSRERGQELDRGFNKDEDRKRLEGKGFRRRPRGGKTYHLLSNPEYLSLVCKDALKGERTRSLLTALLDAMGMEMESENDNALEAGKMARPMKGKKPVQTPGTVRDFALLQISMNSGIQNVSDGEESKKDGGGRCGIIEDTAASFRLAAHQVISYMNLSIGRVSSSSSSYTEKKQKIVDFGRRALMVLFASLRGLLLRLAKKSDLERFDGGVVKFGSVSAFFRSEVDTEISKNYLSQAERLLLEIVPLLTEFGHPPLGEKHALSLVQNLLALDQTTRLRKCASKREMNSQVSPGTSKYLNSVADDGSLCTTIVCDGLIELFVRQLCKQEGSETVKRLRKELRAASSQPIALASGAAASLMPEETHPCRKVKELLFADLQRQIDELDQRKAIANEDARNSKSWDYEFASQKANQKKVGISRPNSVINEEEDSRIIKIDGCIYLSKVATRMMAVRPKWTTPKVRGEKRRLPTDQGGIESIRATSGSSQKRQREKSQKTFYPAIERKTNATYDHKYQNESGGEVRFKRQVERITHTAYFLFHTLGESYTGFSSDSGQDAYELKFCRGDLPSAVLACYLLAGKMEDVPLKIDTFLGRVKHVTLPPPSANAINEYYERVSEGGTPISSEYFTKLLACPTPCPSLIRLYEQKLLGLIGFNLPWNTRGLHPISTVEDICNSLELHADECEGFKHMMNDPCHTHSPLYLLGDPKLVATTLYYLSQQRMGVHLHEDWDVILQEEEGLIKIIANFALSVRQCVKTREQQWKSFKALESLIGSLREKKATNKALSVSDPSKYCVTSVPSASTFQEQLPFSSPLSVLTCSINQYLSRDDDEDQI